LGVWNRKAGVHRSASKCPTTTRSPPHLPCVNLSVNNSGGRLASAVGRLEFPSSERMWEGPAWGRQGALAPGRQHQIRGDQASDSAPPRPRRSLFSFGSCSFLPGTPGTNPKNPRKSLPPLRNSVPGGTGDKPKTAGDTGDKSFHRGSHECGRPAAGPILGAGAPTNGGTSARKEPRPPPPIGGPASPAGSAYRSSSKMCGVMQ
jgi:hypothetical protein